VRPDWQRDMRKLLILAIHRSGRARRGDVVCTGRRAGVAREVALLRPLGTARDRATGSLGAGG
jgi:hypothetical protein